MSLRKCNEIGCENVFFLVPSLPSPVAGVAQLVERQLPKLNVASSNLVSRLSELCGCSSAVEHHVANVRAVGSNPIARFPFLFQFNNPA